MILQNEVDSGSVCLSPASYKYEIKVGANYGALKNVTVLIALNGALLMMIMLVLIRMTIVMLVMNDD